ncbi:MAG: peptide ABC transporter substrate-binding protein [Candidatus Eremiobacteraeota bacterium]|nr:peptide ABC transporter substrate-binding protein [Candidatus Eremiobacteraeota bacterium]
MLGANAAAGDLSMFIYSYAVRFDDKGKPVPDALSEVPTPENGDVSKDGLTLKYKLRHNITWQDGAPLTCKDLSFTWQLVMNPKTNIATTDGYKDIKSIDCTDPYVAVVHMKRVYAPYLQQLWGVNGNAPILPEHILASYQAQHGSINDAPYNALPIGSGPFKVVEWQRGSEVRMEAYEKYFLGAPKLKEVIFKIMPDENTMATQLQTHEIDMVARGTGINWPKYAALAANPNNGLTAIRVSSFLFDHIDFNLKRPIFQDRNLRVALDIATNRQEIIDKIFHGSAIPAETDQHPTLSWAYTNDIEHHPYDLAKAKAMLDADGWKVGPDGIRVKNGQRLQFDLSTQTEATNGRAVQTLLQREWHDAGVQADVKNYSTATMFANGSAGTLEGGHYDSAIFAWVSSIDPDDSSLYSADNFAPRGQNNLFWNNPKATAAMRDALQTVDQAKRKADYVIVQQQLAIDVPTIIISFRKEPYVYNTDLKGYTPSSVISSFWDPWEYSM